MDINKQQSIVWFGPKWVYWTLFVLSVHVWSSTVDWEAVKTNKYKWIALEESKKHKQDSVEFELKISEEKIWDFFLLRFFGDSGSGIGWTRNRRFKQTKHTTFFRPENRFLVMWVEEAGIGRPNNRQEKTGKQRQNKRSLHTRKSREPRIDEHLGIQRLLVARWSNKDRRIREQRWEEKQVPQEEVTRGRGCC